MIPFPPNFCRLSLSAALAVSLLSGSVVTGYAANIWDGGGADNNWNTAANWDDNLLPDFSLGLTFAGATRLAPNNDLAALTVGGITFDATAGAFVLGGNEITLSGGITSNSAVTQTINLPMALSGDQTVNVASGGTVIIGPGGTGSGVISGFGGLTKAGEGLLVLGAENTYSGATTLDGGTLRYTADNAGVQALTFGVSSAAPFSTNTSALDLTAASLTVTGLIVQTNSIDANTITIGSGKTLAVNGNMRVGTTGQTDNVRTNLAVTGEGTLAITGVGNTFVVQNASLTEQNPPTLSSASLDLSGLSNFSFDSGTGSGTFSVAGTNKAVGTLTLANTSNIITTNTIYIGGNNTAQIGVGTLNLGAGTNVINVNNFNIGTQKGAGIVQFAGATGSLKVRGAGGTDGDRATILIGSRTNSGTSVPPETVVTLDGHAVDILAATLTIGNATHATGRGTLAFDSGTIDADSVILGQRTGGTAHGVLTIGGTGVLQVGTSGITIGSSSSTGAGSANGTLNINGGTVTTAGAIKKIQAGTVNSTLNLQGGTLDLQGNSIGDAGSAAITFNAMSGTLKNVSQINGGAGLVKTGAGTLTLDGTNTYTGETAIMAGTLVLKAPSLDDASNVSLTSGAMFNLDFGGVDTINMFFLDGTAQLAGTWGALGSGAEHESGLITGTGQLLVTVPEPGTLAMLALGGGLAGFIYIRRRQVLGR